MANTDSLPVTESLVFRYGADMAPETINAETPSARFVARARVARATPDGSPAAPDTDAGAPASVSGADWIWGILLIQPEPPVVRGEADVITDTGRVTHAAVLTDEAALADPAAVARQARFWELPPAFIAALDGRDSSSTTTGI